MKPNTTTSTQNIIELRIPSKHIPSSFALEHTQQRNLQLKSSLEGSPITLWTVSLVGSRVTSVRTYVYIFTVSLFVYKSIGKNNPMASHYV